MTMITERTMTLLLIIMIKKMMKKMMHYILTQLPFLCVPRAHKTINQVTSLAIIRNENIFIILIIFGDDDDEPTYS